MTKYLSHLEYNRWCRSYLLTFERLVVGLDAMRVALDEIPGKEEIEHGLDRMEVKLEDAVPRNFNPEGEPLTPIEMFTENGKVIINLFYRLLHREEPFRGIYYNEKHRVLKIHHDYKTKEKFVDLKEQVDKFLEHHKVLEEAKQREELAADQGAAIQQEILGP